MTMAQVWLGSALIHLLMMALAIAFISRRDGGPDTLLGALLLGTMGVGLMLLLAIALDEPAATNVALVLALLAPILGIAFLKTQRGRR